MHRNPSRKDGEIERAYVGKSEKKKEQERESERAQENFRGREQIARERGKIEIKDDDDREEIEDTE